MQIKEKNFHTFAVVTFLLFAGFVLALVLIASRDRDPKMTLEEASTQLEEILSRSIIRGDKQFIVVKIDQGIIKIINDSKPIICGKVDVLVSNTKTINLKNIDTNPKRVVTKEFGLGVQIWWKYTSEFEEILTEMVRFNNSVLKELKLAGLGGKKVASEASRRILEQFGEVLEKNSLRYRHCSGAKTIAPLRPFFTYKVAPEDVKLVIDAMHRYKLSFF